MKNNRRIIFVNRFFYPDISATAQILSELVFDLAEKGSVITVLTSRSAYADTGTVYPKLENINGVEIVRVSRNRFSRTNYFGRLIDLVSFYFLVSVKLSKITSAADVLICKTDPPLLIVIGGLIKRFKKCKLISWNQDLFPEVAAKYFDRFPLKLVYPALKHIRDISLKSCDQCVVISNAMKLKLKSLEIDRIHVITNWGKPISADSAKVLALKKNWGIEGKFILEYSGNFGFVHEYDTIKKTIELLKNNSKIVFLFIGSGIHYESLQKYVLAENINNVIFKPYQPAADLPESLSLADSHLVTFLPQMEGLVFPSKFYSICAATRPLLFIGNCEAELATTINANDCGQCFNPGQSQQIADYLIQCTQASELLAKQGQNARKLFQHNHTFEHAQEKWSQVLDA